MTHIESLHAQRQWGEDERLVLDQVKRAVDEVIAPAAAGYDKSGTFPADSIAALNKLGMNGIFVPE